VRPPQRQPPSVRFSVIIPTYQRRDVVVQSVVALAKQELSDFEVIVIVDGSRDGSGDALRELEVPFSCRVVEQSNRGLASARNRGAAEASGELLLFLDDDMEADPSLLLAHDHRHREGADVVIGHIPLHPDSPANFLSAAVGAWAERRGRELVAPGRDLALHDLICGQMSLRRQLFWELDGFDADFTRGGSFGNEDLDFGLRLMQAGKKIVFDPAAISRQRYVVAPRHYLRQWRQAGSADVAMVRKHPDQFDVIFHRRERPIDRLLYRWLRSPIRALVMALVRAAPRPTTVRWFFRVRNLEYFQGIRDAGGKPAQNRVRVLCYHAIADLAGAQVMEPYGIPPQIFRAHMTLLGRHFRFITGSEFLRLLDGKGGVPRRALLVTFDDCFTDLLNVGLPILHEFAVPAIAFAVTQRLGGTNDWDAHLGAAELSLLDGDALRTLGDGGVAIGSHSRTHRALNTLSLSELDDELSGSHSDLRSLRLRSLPVHAYPHGEYNDVVIGRTRAAGYEAAFTVTPKIVEPGRVDRYAVPRVEILRGDGGLRLLWKVLFPDRGGRRRLRR
jgi:glycosyltransferase involved in cell wall biosynthesis